MISHRGKPSGIHVQYKAVSGNGSSALNTLAIITVLLILSGSCGCNKCFIQGNQSSPEPAQSVQVSIPSDTIENYHFNPAN